MEPLARSRPTTVHSSFQPGTVNILNKNSGISLISTISSTSLDEVKHPQTNGKIERFFGEVQRKINKFGSIEKIVHWHNVIKPHMSLDYDEPSNVFWYRLPPERILACAQK